MTTSLGDMIRRERAKIEAGQSYKTLEQLISWYDKHRDGLTKEEAEDCRAALGLDLPLSERPFIDLVPDGWFRDYMEVIKDFESPHVFGFLSAVVVFGQMVGGKVHIKRGGSRLWPGISALLIGPAGETRRSTVCDFAVYSVGVPAGLSVLADSFTYEAMGEELNDLEKPEALIYAGELSTLLGKGSYGESIIPKLTDIIGKTSRFSWKTVKRGKIMFENPCVNALFSSAPDWLAENIPAVAFGGGTWSRFLVGVQEKRQKVEVWSEEIPRDNLDKIIHDLGELTSRWGQFGKPEGECLEWYGEWYVDHTNRMHFGDVVDERLMPYYSRKHDHLLRLTALITLAAGEPMVFTKHRMQQALNILNWLEKDMPKAYSQMALNPLAEAQQMIVKCLERAGGSLDHSRLQRRVYRKIPLGSQFRAIIDSMVEMGSIIKVNTPGTRGTTYMIKRRLDE